jgi:DivIVA domain-containing protein
MPGGPGCLQAKVRHTWHDRSVVVVEIFLIAVVVFGVAAVAMGFGGSMTRFAPDWPGRSLPDGRAATPEDIEAARFSLAFRGYRMSEVDLTMDRLASEIAARDAVIEQLTGAPYQRVEPLVDQPVAAEPDAVGPDAVGPDTIELPAVTSWSDDEAGRGTS